MVWGRGQAEDGKRADAGHGDGCVDDWESCGGRVELCLGDGAGWGGRGMGTYGVRERDGGESRKCPIQQHGLSYISS